MKLMLLVLVATVACDFHSSYGVVARDAARSGQPVAGARFGVQCPDRAFDPWTITRADGTAEFGFMSGGGVSPSCSLALHHRSYDWASTDLGSVCTFGSCQSARWTADLKPVAGRPRAPIAPHPMPDCPNPRKAESLQPLHGVGDLQWQACRGSTRFFVKADPPPPGAGLSFAADVVFTSPAVIGTDATWVPVRAREGASETVAVLRIDDQGSVTVAWQDEPRPHYALTYRLVDLDHDEDPELRVRAPGQDSITFKANESGRFAPWDHPPAGNFEGAVPEVCHWFQEQTKAPSCDPLLDLSASTRVGGGGTLLLVQAGFQRDQLSAAFLVDQGHARLLKAMRGPSSFSRGRPLCVVSFDLTAWFKTEEKFCLRDGALEAE